MNLQQPFFLPVNFQPLATKNTPLITPKTRLTGLRSIAILSRPVFSLRYRAAQVWCHHRRATAAAAV